MKSYDPCLETIVVDVDNVVVESGKRHAEWVSQLAFYRAACHRDGICPDAHPMSSYNPSVGVSLTPLEKKIIFDWWGEADLYDHACPMAMSVDVLETLSSCYNIVFVSHVEGNHGKSKVNFLKRYFPFMSGYAASRQKNIVRSLYNIDDRLEHLTNLPPSVTPLLFKSSWGNPPNNLQSVDWETIHKYIKQY